jgi:hypothetical protein
MNLSRRELLAVPMLAGLARAQQLPPVRAVTRGPNFHWFGYYDKWQFHEGARHGRGVRRPFAEAGR